MFYAIDDITTCPKSSIVVTLVFKGQLKKEMMIKCFEKSVTKQLPKTKALMYPELKRYLVKWLGFVFWKEDNEFSSENHIKYVDTTQFKGEILDEKVLSEIEKRLVQEPYLEKRSPWCINILQNYVPQEFTQGVQDANKNFVSVDSSNVEQYSVALFKVHHSFVDGFSILNLIMREFVDVPEGQLSMPSFPKRSLLRTLLINLVLIFKGPYDTVSDCMMEHDTNPWYLTRERVTNIINSATSQRIPTQKIKSIAKANCASFTGVVVAAISGGIRRYMLERGEKVEPKSMFTCLAPFPVQGHPDTLGNYVSDCYVNFPIGISDPLLRLKDVERQLHEIKHSTLALSSFAMQPIFGGLYHWMVKYCMEFAMSKSTGIFSSFPCPREESMGPCGAVMDTYFTGGHDSPGIGIQFLALNYNKGWKLKIQADKGTLASDAEVGALLAHILKELDNYESNSYDV
ncbi:O-acyltransferase WSD [Folsomia candida]|uniref:O-acyltransferase WSD n=2 Tax=Folsomia candida TaxID=158441 RepID=A0A226DYE3_FOLCA|nr:O-acyltransferase WSD [Folsomia candida]